jgi:Flp pilus assembly protein TadG
MNPLVRFLRRRWCSDQGSVIVELALVLPVLATFALGIVEFGFAFRQANIVERAASAGARVASQVADGRNADFEAIRSVASVTAGIQRSSIRRVTIYQPDASGNMSATCKSLVPSSSSTSALGSNVSGAACNVYSNAQVQTTSPFYGFGGSPTSCSGSWDVNWCPKSRQPGVNQLGVFVEITYTGLTKMIVPNFTVARQAVYLLEPVSVGSS